METERITLSPRERDRLKVLHEVQQKQLTQVAAAERLKVSDRQVRRMLLHLRERGDRSLVNTDTTSTGVIIATRDLRTISMASRTVYEEACVQRDRRVAFSRCV